MSTQPEPALVDALAYALARAPLPGANDTSRDYAERLAPLVVESGWLATAAARAEVARQVRETRTLIGFAGRHLLGDIDVTREDASMALHEAGRTLAALEDAAPRQPEPLDAEETVWTREREQLASGGHRIAGPATQTQDGRWGEAEEACQHGRSAHNDKGCRDCACKVTYDGGLAAPDTTTGTDR